MLGNKAGAMWLFSVDWQLPSKCRVWQDHHNDVNLPKEVVLSFRCSFSLKFVDHIVGKIIGCYVLFS